MKKQILITIESANSLEIVPEHLKGQDKISLQINGIEQLEAIKILSNTLASVINDFDSKTK